MLCMRYKDTYSMYISSYQHTRGGSDVRNSLEKAGKGNRAFKENKKRKQDNDIGPIMCFAAVDH